MLVVSGFGLLSSLSYSRARINGAGFGDRALGAEEGSCIDDETSNTEAAITRAVRKYIYISHFFILLLDNINFRLATGKKFNNPVNRPESMMIPKPPKLP